ncbi:hypothetical protein MTR67_011977 [Solanum verrucosum]|uniref:Tf2-1-like SH3-like domain-containing protein n=1 Tax=Solanum verrucosum TaxID=315347 RepID=A0AAF0TFK5_SOLVR|nr:hypothetical protein MTR67_011977 [Solanum verrucosum]
MAPFETLYGRRCRSPVDWFEVGDIALVGPESVYKAIEKVRLIRERLRMEQNRQKSYADVRRRDLEFEVNDWVYLKISPMKGVMRFGKKEKLSPRYGGPYQILKSIGKVSYELDLSNELALVHPIFHVSMLKNFIVDPVSIIPLEGLGVDESLSYKEVSVEILGRQVKRLRNKEIASVKVLWRNHLVEHATWQIEADMSPYTLTVFLLLLFKLEGIGQGDWVRAMARWPRLPKMCLATTHHDHEGLHDPWWPPRPVVVKMDYSLERLAELYINEIVRLHGIPESTVSDRDPRRPVEKSDSNFGGYALSLDYGFDRSWDKHLALIEFGYNNTYQSSIGMPPYEALY